MQPLRDVPLKQALRWAQSAAKDPATKKAARVASPPLLPLQPSSLLLSSSLSSPSDPANLLLALPLS
eukprot:749080-Hanusia_phi.AAC.1